MPKAPTKSSGGRLGDEGADVWPRKRVYNKSVPQGIAPPASYHARVKQKSDMASMRERQGGVKANEGEPTPFDSLPPPPPHSFPLGQIPEEHAGRGPSDMPDMIVHRRRKSLAPPVLVHRRASEVPPPSTRFLNPIEEMAMEEREEKELARSLNHGPADIKLFKQRHKAFSGSKAGKVTSGSASGVRSHVSTASKLPQVETDDDGAKTVLDWIRKEFDALQKVGEYTHEFHMRLKAVFHRTKGLQDPNGLRTAVSCDLLTKMTNLMQGRFREVLDPLSDELLRSTYHNYPPKDEHSVLEPFFEIKERLTRDIEVVEKKSALLLARKTKIEKAESARMKVLDNCIAHRQMLLKANVFYLWKSNIANVKMQRIQLELLMKTWSNPVSGQVKFFHKWRTCVARTKLKRIRAVLASLNAKKDELDVEVTTLEQQHKAYTEALVETERGLLESRETITKLSKRKRELDALEHSVAVRPPVTACHFVVNLMSEGLALMDSEVEHVLFRGRCGNRTSGLFDPRVMLSGELDAHSAEQYLLDVDVQQLLLLWMNFQVKNTKSDRKAENFSVDLADSEMLMRLIVATYPTVNTRGESVPRLRFLHILSNTVDNEKRAKQLLAYCDRADSIVGRRFKHKAMYSLLNPQDLVASSYPDVAAAWVAELFLTKFNVSLPVENMQQGTRSLLRSCMTEVNLVSDALSRSKVISTELVQNAVRSFAEVCAEVTSLVKTVDRGMRLWSILQSRVQGFLITVITQRLAGDPVPMINYRQERDKISALLTLSENAVGDCFPADCNVSEELRKTKLVFSSFYSALNKIFTFYSQGDLGSSAATMNLEEVCVVCGCVVVWLCGVWCVVCGV